MNLALSLATVGAIEGLAVLGKIADACYVTGIGMAIIFLVLALVWLSMVPLRWFSPPAAPRQISPPPADEAEEEEERLAVAVAAVLAAIRPAPSRPALVKAIIRLAEDATSWARMGRWEQIRNRSESFQRSTGAKK
jgi:Na+-transporting methylmalonyl-CoA/oxaloacetate decarboxylase gamma subunit